MVWRVYNQVEIRVSIFSWVLFLRRYFFELQFKPIFSFTYMDLSASELAGALLVGDNF